MENTIEYIYSDEVQNYINIVKAEMKALESIYSPLIEEAIDRERVMSEYILKMNDCSKRLADIMLENTPIVLFVNGKYYKYKL